MKESSGGGGPTDSGESVLRVLADHTPVGIFVSSAEGRCDYVNRRWSELAGLTPEQALGDGWVAALHPDDAERVLAEWTEAGAAERDSIVEYRFRRPDGEVAWIQGFAAALRDPQGRVTGWVGTCLDLTARKAAEAAVAEASERFKVAFDHTPIGIALVAPDGRYLQVNEALCSLIGYSEEQLLRLSISELTHPDDLAATIERRRRQLGGEVAERRIEKRYLRSDGEVVWVAVTSTLVRDGSGDPLYSVAQIEDITDRIRAQQALEQAEERFRRAFEDAPIGMALVAPDGRFLRVNHTLTEITAYSEAQLLERTFQEITHPEDLDADVDPARQLLAGELRSYQTEKRYLRPDGSAVWVMISVSLVRDAAGEPLHFVSQIEDISERKRAAQELQRLADHDWLTGLLNRRRFTEELQRELLRMARQPERRATLLVLDVDRFKDVNDSLGHRAGDDALRAIAETLTRRLRATDVSARVGGDEFAALVVDTQNPDDAHRIANDIAAAVRSQTILTHAGRVDVTVSIGVVELGADHAGREDQALITADNAMYQAKRNGRDQVTLAA